MSNLFGIESTDAYGFENLDDLYNSDPSMFDDPSKFQWFDHSARFKNGTEVFDYACDHAFQTMRQTFVPFCQFPYVNKGWGKDALGNWNVSNIVMNDCTLSWAEAAGLQQYNSTCFLYTTLALIPVLFNCYFQNYLNLKKKAKDRPRFIFAWNSNVAEKVIKYNMLIGIMHSGITIDIESTRGTISQSLRQLFMSTLMATLLHMLFTQAASWIIIIRTTNGKNKHRNKWIMWFSYFCSFTTYLSELVCGQMQNEVGITKHFTAMRYGQMKRLQYLWFVIMCGSWSFMGARYGKKITDLLKRNAGDKKNVDDARLKKIKKNSYTVSALCSIGVFWRFQGVIAVPHTVNYQTPPCPKEFISTAVASSFLILIMQYGLLYATQPMSQKLHTRIIAVVSTAISGQSSVESRKSTNASNYTKGSKVAPESGISAVSGESSVTSSVTSSSDVSGASSTMMGSSVAMESAIGESEFDGNMESEYDDVEVEVVAE